MSVLLPLVTATLIALFFLLIGGTVLIGFFVSAPFLPTSHRVSKEMVRFAGLKGNETVMDLGAGDGRVLIAAKREHPLVRAIGCEILPTVWLLGKLRIFLSRQTIEWFWRSAFVQDVSAADCIFLYLSPQLMRDLEEKFDRELKPGTIVVSYVFRFPRRQPVSSRSVPWLGGKNFLRLYRW